MNQGLEEPLLLLLDRLALRYLRSFLLSNWQHIYCFLMTKNYYCCYCSILSSSFTFLSTHCNFFFAYTRFSWAAYCLTCCSCPSFHSQLNKRGVTVRLFAVAGEVAELLTFKTGHRTTLFVEYFMYLLDLDGSSVYFFYSPPSRTSPPYRFSVFSRTSRPSFRYFWIFWY